MCIFTKKYIKNCLLLVLKKFIDAEKEKHIKKLLPREQFFNISVHFFFEGFHKMVAAWNKCNSRKTA